MATGHFHKKCARNYGLCKNVYCSKEFQGEVTSLLHILVNVGYFYSDLLKIIRNMGKWVKVMVLGSHQNFPCFEPDERKSL